METITFQTMLMKYGRSPGSVIPLIIFHIGALLAPFFFTWEGLWIGLGLYVLTGFGVTVGFHRLLTHGAFQTHRWVRWIFALLGGLAGQSQIRFWALIHRMHHKWSDREGDPHSPAHGFWWSHWGWPTVRTPQEELAVLEQQFIPDLLKDQVILQVCRWHVPCHMLLAIVLLCGGWLYDGWVMGISWLCWGFFLRITAMLHVTWAVNSIAHTWGYRNYQTKDTSRNNPFVAAVSFGEGWHNNHHTSPSTANFGHRWWEFDPGYQVIRLLMWCGLVWDVKQEHVPLS